MTDGLITAGVVVVYILFLIWNYKRADRED